MERLTVAEVVRAAVSRSAKGVSIDEIEETFTLGGLGYDDGDVLELTSWLGRTATPGTGASELVALRGVRTHSTVDGIVTALRRDRAAVAEVSPPWSGDRVFEVAVVASVAEKGLADFSQIGEEMTLGDLGLDEEAIEKAKTDVFHMLGGKKLHEYNDRIRLGPRSTVGSFISMVASLPGDVITEPKGFVPKR